MSWNLRGEGSEDLTLVLIAFPLAAMPVPVPATIAIIEGTPHVGLRKEEIEMLGKEGHKVSTRRVLPFHAFLLTSYLPPSLCPSSAVRLPC